MTVAVMLRGLIEPVMIEEGFVDAIHALNLASAQGKEFIIAQTPTGDSVAMAMHNILTVQEVEEEL